MGMDLNNQLPERISSTSLTDETFFYEQILEPKSKWKKGRDNRKEIILYASIVLTIVSLVYLYNSIELAKLQIKLSNQPYLVINNTGESHAVELKDELVKDSQGKLMKFPYLKFERSPYSKRNSYFTSIPIVNYGNGNAVNLKITLSLNKDSTIQIIRNLFSNSFIDSCVFKEDGIMLPYGEYRQIRNFIRYQEVESHYFISNNSDSSQYDYFSLPYNYYFLNFLQVFANEDSEKYIHLKMDAKLEYEDVAGNKFNDTYELRYLVYGGGNTDKYCSGGGEISAKRITNFKEFR